MLQLFFQSGSSIAVLLISTFNLQYACKGTSASKLQFYESIICAFQRTSSGNTRHQNNKAQCSIDIANSDTTFSASRSAAQRSNARQTSLSTAPISWFMVGPLSWYWSDSTHSVDVTASQHAWKDERLFALCKGLAGTRQRFAILWVAMCQALC